MFFHRNDIFREVWPTFAVMCWDILQSWSPWHIREVWLRTWLKHFIFLFFMSHLAVPMAYWLHSEITSGGARNRICDGNIQSKKTLTAILSLQFLWCICPYNSWLYTLQWHHCRQSRNGGVQQPFSCFSGTSKTPCCPKSAVILSNNQHCSYEMEFTTFYHTWSVSELNTSLTYQGHFFFNPEDVLASVQPPQ